MRTLSVIILAMGLSWTAAAQPPATEEQADERLDDAWAEQLSPERVEPPPPAMPPDSPVFHWIERLRRRNPVLCERLEKLYREDPRAFHLRVRRLMEQERIRLVLSRYPSVSAAVSNLPPEERASLYRDLAGPGMPPPPHGEGPGRGMMGRRGGHPPHFMRGRPEGEPGETQGPVMLRLRALREKYRATQDPAEREQITSELRNVFDQVYEARYRRHMERLERIEGEIARLKRDLESMPSRRNELIAQQIESWLSTTNDLEMDAEPPDSL